MFRQNNTIIQRLINSIIAHSLYGYKYYTKCDEFHSRRRSEVRFMTYDVHHRDVILCSRVIKKKKTVFNHLII